MRRLWHDFKHAKINRRHIPKHRFFLFGNMSVVQDQIISRGGKGFVLNQRLLWFQSWESSMQMLRIEQIVNLLLGDGWCSMISKRLTSFWGHRRLMTLCLNLGWKIRIGSALCGRFVSESLLGRRLGHITVLSRNIFRWMLQCGMRFYVKE